MTIPDEPTPTRRQRAFYIALALITVVAAGAIIGFTNWIYRREPSLPTINWPLGEQVAARLTLENGDLCVEAVQPWPQGVTKSCRVLIKGPGALLFGAGNQLVFIVPDAEQTCAVTMVGDTWKPLGCSDYGGQESDNVAEFLRDGLAIERLRTVHVRTLRFGCVHEGRQATRRVDQGVLL